jgi:hypothetical protein
MLSELAIDNKEAFADLVTIAKDALAGKSYVPKEVKVETKAAKKDEEVVAEKKPAAKKTTSKKKTEEAKAE